MHSSQHAGDELVDTIALLHKRDQCRDPALIVDSRQEMREDQLLERIDLVLQGHEFGDGFITKSYLVSVHPIFGFALNIPFIWIIDRFQTDVLLVLKKSYGR